VRYELLRGKQLHAIELEELGGGRHRAKWTLKDAEGAVLEERTFELDARELGRGSYSVLVDGEVHDARVERGGTRRTVDLADGDVVFEYLDPLRGVARKAGAGAGGPQTVASPIPGRVVRVPVSVGQDVDEGQAVVVVEAMKMANELRSPVKGRVTAVRVKAGDTVEAATALVVIEPAPVTG
jgi:acetyl/propionyl-CoA carboxylase alpha subunit